MKLLIAFLIPFLLAGVWTMPMEGAVKSFLGIAERDIDIRSDPRNYKPRRWLKENERWAHIPTSTLDYLYHQSSGAPMPTGAVKAGISVPLLYPFPDPFHAGKKVESKKVPWLFSLLPAPFNTWGISDAEKLSPEQGDKLALAVKEMIGAKQE